MKNADLDIYLARAILLQKQLWYNPDTGVGAACLLIPSTGETFYDICRDTGHNSFAHAEHNVINAYTQKNTQPLPTDAIIITTIAPCFNANSSWRVGDSCSTLITRHQVKTVYAGIGVATDPPNPSFAIRFTENRYLAGICQNLHGLFNIKAPRRADGSTGRLVDAYKNRDIYKRVFKKASHTREISP